MSYKSQILATLDAHPELGEYGQTGPLYEMFDCAESTVQYYISVWRLQQRLDFVLPRATRSQDCATCAYQDLCKTLTRRGLPILCEAIEREQQRFFREFGVWGEVVRAWVEGGGR